MEPGQPDVVNQLPVTGNPMEPQSGTYGRVADTERLKQQLDLPGAGPGGAETRGAPPPPGMPQGAQISTPPGGVPDVLMKPTDRPDIPSSTPLSNGEAPQAAQVVQNHIAALQALLQSKTTSTTTKRWAETVLARYGQ